MGTKEDSVFCPSRVHHETPLEDTPNNQKLLCVRVSLSVSLCESLRVSACVGTCVGVRRCANAVEKQLFLGTTCVKKNWEFAASILRSKNLSSETHLRFCRVNLTRQLLVNLAAWTF